MNKIAEKQIDDDKSYLDWSNIREELVHFITSLEISEDQKDILFDKCTIYADETAKRALFKFSNQDVMLFQAQKATSDSEKIFRFPLELNRNVIDEFLDEQAKNGWICDKKFDVDLRTNEIIIRLYKDDQMDI